MKVNIAIASPGDVVEERQAARNVLLRMNDRQDEFFLHPLGWEHSSTPELGDHPQHILDKQIIERADLLCAIFWYRIGTPTPRSLSGTVEEIEEFIRIKGPKRAMLYFCIRPVPHDLDTSQLESLRAFQGLMQSRGLHHTYVDAWEFERAFKDHLEVKLRHLSDGELPLPLLEVTKTPEPIAKVKVDGLPADNRLHNLIDFGNTFTDISNNFSLRMDEFDAENGSGLNKFYDLGAHVFTSAATSLDKVTAKSRGILSAANLAPIESFSTRLKKLAAEHDLYLSSFPKYWKEGRRISDDLKVHTAHILRTANR